MDHEGKLATVRGYYESFESRIGYNLVLKGSKHFGFYPDGKKTISEREAQRNLHNKLAELLDLQKTDVLLDAGSGQGFVSTDLAARFGVKIYGITITPFEVNSAKRKAKKFGVEAKTEYKLMDYHSLKFDDETFTKIYTTETLCHAVDLQKVLNEFFRTLKPGGKIALFEYKVKDEKSLNPHDKGLIDLVIDATKAYSLNLFHDNNFERMLEIAGFKNVKSIDYTKNFYPSVMRLNRYSRIPYKFFSFLGLGKYLKNGKIAYISKYLIDHDLFKYYCYTAEK